MHVPNRATPSRRSRSTPPRARCSEAPGCPTFPRHTQRARRSRSRARARRSATGCRATARRRRSSTRTRRRSRFTVHFDAGSYGEVAQAVVDDTTGQGRLGLDRAAGGLDDGPRLPLRVRAPHQRPVDLARRCAPSSWSGCVDFRRLLSWRTLDLLMLLAPSISLAYFNQGLVFWSVPLVYPPLVYLLVPARVHRACAASGGRRSPAACRSGCCAGAAIFLIGFRGGLDRYDSNVIDVGYAGVVGADRLISGDTPYGTFPTRAGASVRDHATPTAPRRATARPQRGNRCESPIELGDTYGPINYAAYVPAVAMLGLDGPVGRPAGGAPDLGRCSTRCARSGSCSRADGSPAGGSASRSRSRGRPTRSPRSRSSRTRTT